MASPVFGILNWLQRGAFTLVHLVGLIIAIILIVRKKGTPAFLAAAAFGVLLLGDVGYILRYTFLNDWLREQFDSAIGFSQAQFGLNCCCSLFSLTAMVCLIIAIWTAVTTSPKEETPSVEEM